MRAKQQSRPAQIFVNIAGNKTLNFSRINAQFIYLWQETKKKQQKLYQICKWHGRWGASR